MLGDVNYILKKKLPHTVPSYIIYGFFALGIVSAVAFRLIIVFQRVEPAWVRPAWYTGVLGYVGFFLYRYAISRRRKNAVKDYKLIEKIRDGADLSEEDREVMTYLLSSIMMSREDINYLIIFLLSIIAVLADLVISYYL